MHAPAENRPVGVMLRKACVSSKRHSTSHIRNLWALHIFGGGGGCMGEDETAVLAPLRTGGLYKSS